MWQQGWSSIIIPQWIKMSVSARTQHPQRWPVATEWQLSAPLNLPSATPAWRTPARALAGAVGRAWRQRLPPPWWPAELSQPQNQGHAPRGPDFIITKPFLLQPAWNWLQETFHSIFSKHFALCCSLIPSKTNTKGCIQRVQICSVCACDATGHWRAFEKR